MSFYSIISQQFRGSLKRNMPQHFKLPQHDWNKCVSFPRWLLSRGQGPPGSITPRTFFGKTVPLLYSYIPLGNKYEIINTELFFRCCSWSLGSEPCVNLNKSQFKLCKISWIKECKWQQQPKSVGLYFWYYLNILEL